MDDEDMELFDENCSQELPLDVTPVSSCENIAPTRRPKRIHTLTCNICDRDLDSNETSTSHIVAIHMDQSFFACSMCPFHSHAGFPGLYRHTKRRHQEIDADIGCRRFSYMAEVSKWTSTCFDNLAFNARLKRARLEEIFKQNSMPMVVDKKGTFADLNNVKEGPEEL